LPVGRIPTLDPWPEGRIGRPLSGPEPA